MTSIRIRFSGAAALLPVLLVASVPALAQSSGALARAVEAALHEERGLRRLEVEVSGAEVTLAGDVDTFWLKHAALQRTLDVPGVGTVVSEIAVPAAESDQRLAEEVGRVVREYPDITEPLAKIGNRPGFLCRKPQGEGRSVGGT